MLISVCSWSYHSLSKKSLNSLGSMWVTFLAVNSLSATIWHVYTVIILSSSQSLYILSRECHRWLADIHVCYANTSSLSITSDIIVSLWQYCNVWIAFYAPSNRKYARVLCVVRKWSDCHLGGHCHENYNNDKLYVFQK